MKRLPGLALLAAAVLLTTTSGTSTTFSTESTSAAPSSGKSQRSYPYFHRNSYFATRAGAEAAESSSSTHQLAPPGDITSSASYEIRPESASDLGSMSNVNFKTNALPFVVRPGGTYNSRNRGPTPKYEFPKMATGSQQSYRDRWGSGGSSSSSYDPMYFRCPPGQDCRSEADVQEDDYRSYYSVLNGNQRPAQAYSQRNENRRYDDIKDSDILLSDTFHATFPFTVRGVGPRDKLAGSEDGAGDGRFSNRFGLARPRPTRTSSAAQKWVRLQPLTNRDPSVYDPFFDKTNEEKGPPKGPELMDPSTYSNRLGVELSPETFAERWGYQNKRIPSWLDETGHKSSSNSNGWGWTSTNTNEGTSDGRKPVYGTPYNGPTRDEDPKNWVKLEPIPVAGVSISKWVPKGTQPEHLPTTGNNVRDKPTAWWDRVDQVNKRPGGGGGETTFRPGMMGWTQGATSTLPTPATTDFPIIQSHRVKNPSTGETTSWNDIIYPDDPVSATSSWESTTTFKQKFPSPVKMGWDADTARRPAVASWSASGTKGLNHRHRFGVRRPETPSHYPDPLGAGDDPRWMLVSNSKRVTNYGHGGGHHQKYSNQHRYRPFPDKFRDDFADDEDEELQNFRLYHSNRVAKDYKPTHDDIFLKLNATLNQLEPVLNHTESSTSSEASKFKDKPSNTFRNEKLPESEQSVEVSTTNKPTSTTTPRSILSPFRNTFLSTLFRTSRQSNEQQQQPPKRSTSKKQKAQETSTAKAQRKTRPNTSTTTPRPSRMFEVLKGVIGKRRKRHTE